MWKQAVNFFLKILFIICSNQTWSTSKFMCGIRQIVSHSSSSFLNSIDQPYLMKLSFTAEKNLRSYYFFFHNFTSIEIKLHVWSLCLTTVFTVAYFVLAGLEEASLMSMSVRFCFTIQKRIILNLGTWMGLILTLTVVILLP